MTSTTSTSTRVSRREFHVRLAGLVALGTAPFAVRAQPAAKAQGSDAAWQRAVEAARADAASLRALPLAGVSPAFVPSSR